MVRKLFVIIMTFVTLSTATYIYAQDTDLSSNATLGISLSEEQKMETLDILGASEITSNDIIVIDGIKVNEYLNDGSSATTDIYSSAYVELKPEGYGVQVQILTPENITSVSESTYQSAAITAGAQNVLIKIASIIPVTGEGALTGVYETFKQAGFSLDETAIKTAEDQLTTEQKLIELTGLSSEEVSMLVNSFNILIINSLNEGEEIIQSKVRDLITGLLAENNYDFSEEAIRLLVDHGMKYSQSPVAQDLTTLDVIETSTAESIIGKSFVNGDITVTIDDIYLTDERDPYHGRDFDNILVMEYTLKNNKEQEHHSGNEFEVYVSGHKAEQYYSMYDKGGPVSPTRTISVRTSFGFNGDKENIELELKDRNEWDSNPTIIPTGLIRDTTEEIIDEEIDSKEPVKVSSAEVVEELEYIEVNNRELLKPGEYIIDDVSGKVTLLKIVHPEETFEIVSGLEVTIHTVKLLKLSEIPKESVDMLSFELDISEDGGQYIQYEYTIVNNNPFKLYNTTFDTVIYSDGEQVNDYVYSFGEPYELLGNSKVTDAVATTGAPDTEITGFTLYMNYLHSDESNGDLESQPIEVDFE